MSLHGCGLVIEAAEWALECGTQSNGKNCLSTMDSVAGVFHAFIVTFNIPNFTFPFYRQYLSTISENLSSE